MAFLPLLAALALPPADTVRLVLAATTDIHGHATDWDYLRNAPWPGGLVRVAGVLDSLRERYPGQVVLVDAGDCLQGDPLAAYFGRVVERRPHPVVDAMNALGYDAVAIGDHDFDFGLDRFQQAVADAGFPWVSANLRVLPEDTLAFPPYTVIQRGPVKIAVAGLLTPGTMVWQRDRLRGRYRVDRIERDLDRVVGDMRRDADLVIVLSHGGLGGPSSYDTTGVGEEHGARRFATAANRPDLVVLGHTHGEFADTALGGVRFVRPGPFAQALAVIEVWLVEREGKWRPVRMTVQSLSLAETRPAARVARRLAEPHRLTLGWLSTVIGEARGRFTAAAARAEDTPLVRLVQDAFRRATGAELAATPVYDLGTAFGPGEIRIGDVFRLAPTEEQVRAVRLSGEDLRAYLEQNAWYYYADSSGRVAVNRHVPAAWYDLVAGVEYTMDLSRPPDARITRLLFRGRPVVETDTFTLALTESRHQGVGRYAMLAGAPLAPARGGPIRDLLIAEIQRRRVLDPNEFGGVSWRIEPEDAARKARALFVREPVREAQAAEPVPAPLVLPVAPARREGGEPDSVVWVGADSTVQRPVAHLRQPAEPGAGRALARLLADAFRTALRADVALLTFAEVGAPLPAGRVTVREVEAAAAGTEGLVAFTVTGEELRAILENVVATGQPCCELSGLRVRYDPRGKPFDRVREARFTNGRDIARTQPYRLVISSRLVAADSVFVLGGTRCRPEQGCAEPGSLARWTAVWSPKRPAEALADYLRALPQPVALPDDPRLTPSR